MLAVTMETAVEGVEASLAEMVNRRRGVARVFGKAELFWLRRVRLPWLYKAMTRQSKVANQSTAKLNLSLVGIKTAVDFASGAQVDPNFRLREVLERVKQDACESRLKYLERLSEIDPRNLGLKPFEAELKRGLALSLEMFNIANQIQWELAEHDADFATRSTGFVAASAAETEKILDRILAGG